MKTLNNLLVNVIATLSDSCGALEVAKDPREAISNYSDIDEIADEIVADFSDALRDAIADTYLARAFEAISDAEYADDFDHEDLYDYFEVRTAKAQTQAETEARLAKGEEPDEVELPDDDYDLDLDEDE